MSDRPDFDPENFDPASVVEEPAITYHPKASGAPSASWRWWAAGAAAYWMTQSKHKLAPFAVMWYLLTH